MKTVSSYGVELRKQNIPVRQTLDIYRTAVSCLTGIYAQIWDELAVMTCDFQRCLLISEGQLSSMPWEAYPHIRQGWNCGKKRIRKAAGRSWCVIIMPCRYSTVM